jgi:hypothetical protein
MEGRKYIEGGKHTEIRKHTGKESKSRIVTVVMKQGSTN